MDASLMADDSGDPLPAVNWALVDDDQEWRRKEGSKSAPPMLNVSGFPGADHMFFYRPEGEAPKPVEGRREEGDEVYRHAPGKSPLPPQLGASFQEFINSMTNLNDSPEATPSHSLHSSFSSMPTGNTSFTSMLLKHTGSQHPRPDKEKGGGKGARGVEQFYDSPALHPADNGAIPIRIPGFGTSPQAQSLLLGTPPASLASLGGEPYLVNNSPSAGSFVPTTVAAPQATWPRPTFTNAEEQASSMASSSRKAAAKNKSQRLTFQDAKEAPPKAKPPPREEAGHPLAEPFRPGAVQHREAKGSGKGGASHPVERRLFPALEGEVDGHYSSLEDVIGNIYLTAKDQYGCRFLQKTLEDGHPQYLAQILDEVYEHCVELMTDPFGNYLMQKLVERCNDDQRTLIAQKVAPQLVNISLNMHGTRAVQTLIESLSSVIQVQIIINALRDSVVPLIKDLNGNHVIQRCLQKFTAQDKQFVYEAAIPRCVDVATHRHGCCVIQRCIDHASEEQKLWLTDEIARNALVLVTDPFGNYVVQYVLELNAEPTVRKICAAFRGCFVGLCMNKFSSNVMEKCLQSAPDDVQEGFITELMEPMTLPKLLQDQYANYVVQTALTVSKPPQFAQLQEAIRAHIHLVRNTPYGKKIENKLNRGGGRGGAGGGRGKSRGSGGAGGKGYSGTQPSQHTLAHHQNGHPHQHRGAGPRSMMNVAMPPHMSGHMAPVMQGGQPGLPVHMQMPMAGAPHMMPGNAMNPQMMPPGGMPMGGMEPGIGSWDDAHAHMYWT